MKVRATLAAVFLSCVLGSGCGGATGGSGSSSGAEAESDTNTNSDSDNDTSGVSAGSISAEDGTASEGVDDTSSGDTGVDVEPSIEFASDPIQWRVPVSSASAEVVAGGCVGADTGFDSLFASDCKRWSTLDVDGDGRPDLVSTWDTSNDNTIYGFGSQDHYWLVFLGGVAATRNRLRPTQTSI